MEIVEKKEPVSMFIESTPIGETKPKLAPVGWITSAYLYAFYSFGYRYIFHPDLDSIREYIYSSFNESKQEVLEVNQNVFDIREIGDQYFNEPKMELIVPLDNKELIHLKINILRYQIKLPFRCSPSVLLQLIVLRMPDFVNRVDELKDSGSFLRFQIKQKKIGGVDSLSDYLLGKKIP